MKSEKLQQVHLVMHAMRPNKTVHCIFLWSLELFLQMITNDTNENFYALHHSMVNKTKLKCEQLCYYYSDKWDIRLEVIDWK